MSSSMSSLSILPERKRRNILRFVVFEAAVALSFSSQVWRVTAFVCPQSNCYQQYRRMFSVARFSSKQRQIYSMLHRNNGATLVLYSSHNNNKREKSFLEKVGNAVESILPKGCFGSDEEKKKLAQRQRVENQISGGLDDLLRDAPSGLQMMGKMLSPLMGTAVSTLAETMADQQRNTETLLEDARVYLVRDPVIVRILGEPIDLRSPFSQSSSTTIINGETQSRVELAFEVIGNKSFGVARLSATDGAIVQITTEAGGRIINVNLSKQQPSSYDGYFSSSSDDDNIIEAEIVDKETK